MHLYLRSYRKTKWERMTYLTDLMPGNVSHEFFASDLAVAAFHHFWQRCCHNATWMLWSWSLQLSRPHQTWAFSRTSASTWLCKMVLFLLIVQSKVALAMTLLLSMLTMLMETSQPPSRRNTVPSLRRWREMIGQNASRCDVCWRFLCVLVVLLVLVIWNCVHECALLLPELDTVCKALASGLLASRGVLVTNFLPSTDLAPVLMRQAEAGSQHSFLGCASRTKWNRKKKYIYRLAKPLSRRRQNCHSSRSNFAPRAGETLFFYV